MVQRSRLMTALASAAGVMAIGYGVVSARTGPADIRPPLGVDRFIPRPGDLMLRQAQVGIDLSTGYRGELIIDGQNIPTYDLAPNDCSPTSQAFAGRDAVYDPGQNTLYFTPGPGSTIERFAPGDHRIVARYWRVCESPDTAQEVNWTFKVS